MILWVFLFVFDLPLICMILFPEVVSLVFNSFVAVEALKGIINKSCVYFLLKSI